MSMKEFRIHEEENKMPTGFTTPDGYFDSFTERLMANLPQPEVKVVPLYRRKPVWLSAAAAFLVIITAGIFFLLSQPAKNQPNEADIQNYLVYNTNINVYDISQNLDDQDIKSLESSFAANDDAIEEYLLDDYIYE